MGVCVYVCVLCRHRCAGSAPSLRGSSGGSGGRKGDSVISYEIDSAIEPSQTISRLADEVLCDMVTVGFGARVASWCSFRES